MFFSISYLRHCGLLDCDTLMAQVTIKNTGAQKIRLREYIGMPPDGELHEWPLTPGMSISFTVSDKIPVSILEELDG